MTQTDLGRDRRPEERVDLGLLLWAAIALAVLGLFFSALFFIFL